LAGTGDLSPKFQQGLDLKAGATPISGVGPMSGLSRVRLDEFTTAMLATVMLGFLPPCRGTSALIFGGLAAAAIGLLFFLQGARLSRTAIIAGALHWRLHLVIFAATFVLFPVVGLALRPLSGTLLTPPLYLGLLFLCTLPSTVQDSVAFTSIAGGNVAAALCSASASPDPAFGGPRTERAWRVFAQCAEIDRAGDVPSVVAGQLLQPWIGSWV
jgi:solute carrier family 10 (sodium/bile acid cotransporter), member 7